MDVSAVNTLLVASPQYVGARGAAAVTVDAPGTGREVGRVATDRATSTQVSTQKAEQQRLQAQEREKPVPTSASESRAAVGRIRFELQEGMRVAQFFDTKDVLIYQVPPEGRVYLVTANQTPAKDQVETEA